MQVALDGLGTAADGLDTLLFLVYLVIPYCQVNVPYFLTFCDGKEGHLFA